MNNEEYLAGLLGGAPADISRTPEQRAPLGIPYAEGTAPSDIRERGFEQPPMDLAGRMTSVPVTAEMMREMREKERTKLRNEAILETLGQTVDPLGYTAEEMFGDETPLERYLVEFADIPFSAVKGLAKGILGGSVALGAIPFKTKAAKANLEKILETEELSYMLNEVNPLQEAMALNEYFRRDPMVLRSFSDEAVQEISPREGMLNVPVEGSHRTIVNEAANLAAQKKGLEQVPRIYSKDVELGGPSVFGPDKNLLEVYDESKVGNFRTITDNLEGLETVLADPSLFFRTRPGSTMPLSAVTPEIKQEMTGLKNLQAMNLDLQDYLNAKYEIPVMKGQAAVDDYLDRAMFQSAGGPTLDRRGLEQVFDYSAILPFSEVGSMGGASPARYWESRLASMLGGTPNARMLDMVESGAITPETMKWNLEAVGDFNRSPLERWMAQRILQGDAVPIDKWSGGLFYDQGWLRQLDEPYLNMERAAMERAGARDPFPTFNAFDELKRTTSNRKRQLKAEQDLKIRELGEF